MYGFFLVFTYPNGRIVFKPIAIRSRRQIIFYSLLAMIIITFIIIPNFDCVFVASVHNVHRCVWHLFHKMDNNSIRSMYWKMSFAIEFLKRLFQLKRLMYYRLVAGSFVSSLKNRITPNDLWRHYDIVSIF